MNDLTDIPLAVKNIRLCQAFKGYNPGILDIVDVVCHVIVSETFPRAKATEQSKMIEFAMDNNVELSFERKIIF